MKDSAPVTATGGCLCSAVRYTLRGPLRGVVNCHCAKCRRFHGHYGAYTSVKVTKLVFTEDRGLKWYASVSDETPDVQRGFCSECGSSLFWHPKGREGIAVAAGSLDVPTRLRTIGHVWLSQKSDYYDLCDDELGDDLPRFDKGWAAMTGSKLE